MDLAKELKEGLCSRPKYIPVSLRYDHQGLQYDEQCFDLDEYYHYRAEEALIKSSIKDVVSNLCIPCKVFDIGCGNTKKAQMLLNELLQYQNTVEYAPIDVSKDFLNEVCDVLFQIYGDSLKVDPMSDDLFQALSKIGNYRGRKALLWISGLQIFPKDTQLKMLSNISSTLEGNDVCLITADITQNKEVIEKAYLNFDEQRPNAKLYTNGIHVLNREFEANIDISQFKLEGKYVEDKDVSSASCVQVWLRSLCKQSYNIEKLGITMTLEEGEKLMLHGGNGMSHKYTSNQLEYLFAKAHLRVLNKWENENSALFLCKREM
ncbi:uncharacterized protein LOC133175887 [Saccostrea echinata]|uniref:uncharacterized protein LOC133175887 n=1 Tax=Saccostrea echinata TaxID=191078 RepID=UPI002A81CC05|nr:uncharacterized protein LOC133175887 [Saccostrea echinata]